MKKILMLISVLFVCNLLNAITYYCKDDGGVSVSNCQTYQLCGTTYGGNCSTTEYGHPATDKSKTKWACPSQSAQGKCNNASSAVCTQQQCIQSAQLWNQPVTF